MRIENSVPGGRSSSSYFDFPAGIVFRARAITSKATQILLASTLAIYATCASADWIRVGENDRLVTYYEPAKAGPDGTTTVWVMFDYKTEQISQRSGRRYSSQKGQQEVDCRGQRTRTVFFSWHEGRMGNGVVVYTGRQPIPWEPNSPDSIGRIISAVVCGL
jgi:hypothetical protein